MGMGGAAMGLLLLSLTPSMAAAQSAPAGEADAAAQSSTNAAPSGSQYIGHPHVPKIDPAKALPPPPNEEHAKNPNIMIHQASAGHGYCRFTDMFDKIVYYSPIFEENRSVDTTPLQAKFLSFLKKLYLPASYSDSGVQYNVICQWNEYAADYSMQDAMKRDEFLYILQNFKIKITDWKP
jgi:hypothetical protein